jgi:hypothetical protein
MINYISTTQPVFKNCPECIRSGRGGVLSVRQGEYLTCNYAPACSFKEKAPIQKQEPQVDLDFAHPGELRGAGNTDGQFGKLIACSLEDRGIRAHINQLRGKKRGINDPDIILAQGSYIVSENNYLGGQLQ